MDKSTRDLFKRLLLDLPPWNGQRERKTFIHDALWGHVITRHLVFEGEPDTVASELLSRCVEYDTPTEEGRSPLCAVLAEIRNRGLVTGEGQSIVADLERRLGCASSKPTWSSDPYPGLLTFDHWQAPIFFGRTVETRDLLRQLDTEQGRRLLIVTGSSGAGKSSLVRAGLWAKLKAGTVPHIPGSDQWLITAMFPTAQGGDPFLALASSLAQEPRLGGLYPYREAETLRNHPGAFADLLNRVLAGLPPTAEWLLILDQMEELFTPAAESYRATFLDFLLAAVELPRFRVVATVRSDFYAHCEAYPGLREALNRDGGRYSVGVPGPLAMTRMVAGPVEDMALATPVTLDTDLVSAIVDEAVAEPGGLALMAFALKDLYDQCKATGRMDLRAYQGEAFGGLKGVIARRADRAFERTGEAGRAALPRVFSHLVTVQDDGTATRRRADKARWAGDAAAETLIAEFTRQDTRLLVVGPDRRPTVEVAHEALLREWPLLRDWIRDRREALRLRDRIVAEAKAWAEQGQPAFLLWKHERLAPARALLEEADLLEHLEQDEQIADFLTPEVDRLLAELVHSSTDDIRREDIGRRLSEIDARLGVSVKNGVPDILWRLIPAGEVEIEGHGRFNVAPFRMAAYPVTYIQYKTFLDCEDGYTSATWWGGLQHRPESGTQLHRYASYPADNVSWYDATAFCRWLSTRLGFEIRLPDEWEWQWAAQSACADFAYPWGSKWRKGVSNINEAGIGRTMAVGMYPEGRSLQDVYDLVGNIWEWCRNSYNDPHGRTTEADMPSVVRGRFWRNNMAFSSNDNRYLDHPSVRGASYGFRVVCAAPILR